MSLALDELSHDSHGLITGVAVVGKHDKHHCGTDVLRANSNGASSPADINNSILLALC